MVTNGSVWFHDGQLGTNCQYEKKFNEFTVMELHRCHNQKMSNVTSGICSRVSGTHSCHAAAMALSMHIQSVS
jgi:hypothetical protein